MLRWRFVGVSMLLAWLSLPTLETLSAATGDPHRSCEGHACRCQQRQCPPKRPAGKDCHEAPAGPRCEMTSRCNHGAGETNPPGTASRLDAMVRAPQELALDLVSLPASEARDVFMKSGHSRIDPRPPRTAS
jgi:hypothetical protein